MTTPKPKKHKQRFEHECHFSDCLEDSQELMEDMEKEGFELVTVVYDGAGLYTLFFKRPV